MADKKKKSGSNVSEGDGVKSSPYSPAGIRLFYGEVAAEFKKIVWPDRKVTLGLSGFVVVLTVLLSIYLGTVDFVLGRLVSFVLR